MLTDKHSVGGQNDTTERYCTTIQNIYKFLGIREFIGGCKCLIQTVVGYEHKEINISLF